MLEYTVVGLLPDAHAAELHDFGQRITYRLDSIRVHPVTREELRQPVGTARRGLSGGQEQQQVWEHGVPLLRWLVGSMADEYGAGSPVGPAHIDEADAVAWLAHVLGRPMIPSSGPSDERLTASPG
jgi:hypothetical protein